MDATLTQLLTALYAQDQAAIQQEQRIADLEHENAELKAKLATAPADAADAVDEPTVDAVHSALLRRQRRSGTMIGLD